MKSINNFLSSLAISTSLLVGSPSLGLCDDVNANVQTTQELTKDILESNFPEEIKKYKKISFLQNYSDYNTFISMIEKNESDGGFSFDDKKIIFNVYKCVDLTELESFMNTIGNGKNITSHNDLDVFNKDFLCGRPAI